MATSSTGHDGFERPGIIERGQSLPAVGAYEGQIVFVVSTGRVWSWTNGAWASVTVGASSAVTGPTGPSGPTGASGPVIITAWTDVAFTVDYRWANYGAGYQAVQYRTINTTVYIRGLMVNGDFGFPAFTLPVGFRPPATLLFAADTNSNAHGRFDINSSGQFIPVAGSSVHFGVNCEFSSI